MACCNRSPSARADPTAYFIVAGERRYRAHMVNRAATIRAIVIETTDTADIRVKQIIENDQRADVPPLEQAAPIRPLWTNRAGRRPSLAPASARRRTASPSVPTC